MSKTMSMSTLGLIDFRSDKGADRQVERAKTSKAAKEQTKLLRAQLDLKQNQMLQAQSTVAIHKTGRPDEGGRPRDGGQPFPTLC